MATDSESPKVDSAAVDNAGVDGPEERGARFLPSTPRGWVLSLLAMLYFAGAVGYMIGARNGDSSPGRESVDVGFLQDMISHHEQAIEMSNIELAGGAVPGIQSFAREILSFQAYEIGVMEGQLAEWGLSPENRSETAMAWMDGSVPVDRMPGLASIEEMDRFGDAADRDVDALFVPLMQDHHRGGIHMATFAADEASDPAVRELAARMVRNQRVEVNELGAAGERAGLDPTPEGYVADLIPADHAGHGS